MASTTSRQGKQPPEAVWTLLSETQPQQVVEHALRLLQSPHTVPASSEQQSPSADTAQADSESAVEHASFSAEQTVSSTKQDPAAEAADLTASPTQSPAIHAKPLSNTVDDQFNEVQSQTEAALPTDSTLPPAATGPVSDADSNASATAQPDLHQPEAKTDQQRTQQPAAVLEQSPSTAAGAGVPVSSSADRVHETDEYQSQASNATDSHHTSVQSTPAPSHSQADMHGGVGAESTPVVAPERYGVTPSAPQRVVKSRVGNTASTSVHKSLAFTPAASDAAVPHAHEFQQQVKTSAPAQESQADVATLIRTKFAELMANKELTPNEAAVLAVQHVSAARR